MLEGNEWALTRIRRDVWKSYLEQRTGTADAIQGTRGRTELRQKIGYSVWELRI